jgi:hypothetical protein
MVLLDTIASPFADSVANRRSAPAITPIDIGSALNSVRLVTVVSCAARSDAVLMRGQQSSKGSRVLVGATVVAMSAAAVAMFAL